jgi:twinkle protein
VKILGRQGEDFFEGRGISIETAARFGIYTAKRAGHEVVPSVGGDIIVIPYTEHGVTVNEKFRTLDKKFWQWTNKRPTFFNSDILDDPALEQGTPLIITEGELDCLAAIDCGFPFAVSVPDGAPPPAQGEAQAKLEYLWNNKDRIRHVKRFVLAVDADAPGKRLADELCRALSASRCCFIEYPLGCKDLNDVLIKNGPQIVAKVLNEAKPFPVRGLYWLNDYPEREPIETFTTGWPLLDQHFQLFRGGLTVVTGIPSHGKSAWCLNILMNVAKFHGWRSVVFSPEMPTVPFMRDRLERIHGGSDEAARRAFIQDRFCFIDNDPSGDDDESFTLDWVLDKATDAVLRDGVNCLLLDPWNELEHARQRDENITDYVGRCLRDIKRWARLRKVAVIIVAHPTKEIRREGKTRTPTLYDIESSAHWFNKCDHGIVIERSNEIDQATIHIAKSRFEEAGVRGSVRMGFDRHTNRFEPLKVLSEELL